MNSKQLEANWEEVMGQVKAKWGKFTDDEITEIGGNREKLIGKLRKHYGYTADQADQELESFLSSCECSCDSKNDSQLAKARMKDEGSPVQSPAPAKSSALPTG